MQDYASSLVGLTVYFSKEQFLKTMAQTRQWDMCELTALTTSLVLNKFLITDTTILIVRVKHICCSVNVLWGLSVH